MASPLEIKPKSPKFSSLPIELRPKIFEIHLLTPRIVELYVSEKLVKLAITTKIYTYKPAPIPKGFFLAERPTTPIPPPFRVNRESRAIAFEAFGIAKKKNKKFRYLGPRTFIFQMYTLFLSQWYYMLFFHLRGWYVFPFHDIKSVASASHIWKAKALFGGQPFYNCIPLAQRNYPKLEEFVSLDVPRLENDYTYRRRHRIWYRKLGKDEEADAIRQSVNKTVLLEFQKPFLEKVPPTIDQEGVGPDERRAFPQNIL